MTAEDRQDYEMQERMFRQMVILALVFVAVVSPMGGEAAEGVEWLEKEHDFGTIFERDGKVSHRFMFVNRGEDDVVIKRVRSMCGCTTVDYPRRPVAVGDTAVVTATFDPAGRAGRFDMFFVVLFGGEEQSRLTLMVKGSVIAEELTVNEKYPISVGSLKLNARAVPFGELTKGEKREAVIEAYNDGEVAMKYYVSELPRGVRVSPKKGVVAAKSRTFIKVTLDTDKWRCGFNEGQFNLLAEPEERGTAALAGITQVDVTAVVLDDSGSWGEERMRDCPVLRLSADRVLFTSLGDEAPSQTQTIEIVNAGKDPLEIYDLRAVDECVKVEGKRGRLRQGESVTIAVTVNADKMDDKVLNTSIIIYSNDPHCAKMFVRVVGAKK